MNKDLQRKKQEILDLSNLNDIKHVLDKAYSILRHPILMFDTSYTLLMKNNIATDDWVWNEISMLGTFSHETVNFFNREHFIEAFAISETVSFMRSTYLEYERANGKLFDKDNVQLGNISVLACFLPFQDGDMELIELLCEILSVKLQNSDVYYKIDRVYQETLLDRIIGGDITVSEEEAEIITELSDDLKSNLYVAVIDIAQYDITNTHLAYFRDLFRKMQRELKYFLHLNNIAVIISTDSEILDIKEVFGKLLEFFEMNSIYAGISSRFQDIFELSRYYKEAIVALNHGLDSKRKQNIFCFDDFRLEHYLRSIIDEKDTVFSPLIQSIKKFDIENHSNTADVLYIYLLYGMNAHLTSKHLGISVNELSEVISNLEENFYIDWTNGNMLLNLFISLKFMNETDSVR